VEDVDWVQWILPGNFDAAWTSFVAVIMGAWFAAKGHDSSGRR
jgi:hypothetical protein